MTIDCRRRKIIGTTCWIGLATVYHTVVHSGMYTIAYMGIRTSLGQILPVIFPQTFFSSQTIPPFTWCWAFPLYHHYPPVYNIKRSNVNVYKIDSG